MQPTVALVDCVFTFLDFCHKSLSDEEYCNANFQNLSKHIATNKKSNFIWQEYDNKIPLTLFLKRKKHVLQKLYDDFLALHHNYNFVPLTTLLSILELLSKLNEFTVPSYSQLLKLKKNLSSAELLEKLCRK